MILVKKISVEFEKAVEKITRITFEKELVHIQNDDQNH